MMARKRSRSGSPTHRQILPPTAEEIHEKFGQLEELDFARSQYPDAFINDPVAQSRDRFPKIRAWAANRIHLDGLANCYINASPITLGENRYIATQGPTEENLIWRMVWQCEVSVIVMLTRLVEKDENKCFAYYPQEQSESIGSGDFQVFLLGKTEEDGTDIRKLKIVHMGSQRIVWHLLYKDWPDYGVPTGPNQTALLALMKLSRAKNQANGRRLVHCSAGCGRTGTFIALDHLLQRLEEGTLDLMSTEDEVFQTVKLLREQRMKQVYTEGQLNLIYQMLHELWKPEEGREDQISDFESTSSDFGLNGITTKRQRTNESVVVKLAPAINGTEFECAESPTRYPQLVTSEFPSLPSTSTANPKGFSGTVG